MKPIDVLKISEPVEQMYMDCTSQLIINLCRHLDSGAETTAQWEIRKLAELDQLTTESVEIIAANTGKSKEVIQQVVIKAVDMELGEAEAVLSGAAQAGLIQGAKATLATSPAVKSVVKSLTEQAYDDSNIVNTVMLNSTRSRYVWAVQTASSEAALIEELQGATDLASLEKQLAKTQRALNTATFSVASGAEARTTALRRVIGQLAAEGITGYIDRGGHHWSPEAYINMDIRTTVHNAAVQAQKSRSAEYGVSTFQISSHIGARPLCAPYQGKFYSWDNTSGTVEDLYGRKYSYAGINTTSYGLPAGIFGINCGHNPQTFVSGYNIPRYSPTEDAEENERVYKLTQQQRYYERQIRTNKTKALSYQAAGDKVGFERSAAYIKAENARYKQFCAANGLTPRNDRLQVVGYNKSISGKVNAVPKMAVLPEKQIKLKPAKGITVDALQMSGNKEYDDILTSVWANGNPTVKRLWEKIIPKEGIVSDFYFAGRENYSLMTESIQLNVTRDIRQKGMAYFHEHGHAIDNFGAIANGGTLSEHLSENPAFIKALRADLKTLRASKGSPWQSTADKDFIISIELCKKDDAFNGVSDILDGLTKGKASGKYGHAASYWRGDKNNVAHEAFAHMTEAAFSDECREAIVEYFPTAWETYLKIVEDAL